MTSKCIISRSICDFTFNAVGAVLRLFGLINMSFLILIAGLSAASSVFWAWQGDPEQGYPVILIYGLLIFILFVQEIGTTSELLQDFKPKTVQRRKVFNITLAYLAFLASLASLGLGIHHAWQGGSCSLHVGVLSFLACFFFSLVAFILVRDYQWDLVRKKFPA